jgi:CheY-like chemotaxis protein
MTKPRVLLADDHRMVTEGLKGLLTEEFELVGIVEDGRTMVSAAGKLRPDVIVADISMPQLNGIDALALLKRDNPDVRVVFLTMHRDAAYARRALEAGASGFVLKHSAPAELVLAVRAALAEVNRALRAWRCELNDAEVVTDDEVGVEPPAEATVKALGALDVRNRDGDGLELHGDRPCSWGLDSSFGALHGIAHVNLLGVWLQSKFSAGP